MSKGYVYLIGAGPGDQGLITVKGLNAIREADVVIYDYLAPASLLNEARLDAKLLCAGKRAGQHYMKQEEITALIVEQASLGLTVARLKGGDPFIFGRGGEEALELSRLGIPFEIVPGISSSYAVAAYNGIPVTHRTMASSFHVITGHEDARKETSVLDYQTLADTEGTLVFLMGLASLPKIAQQLIAHGKPANTKAAVMQEGTTSRQRIVISDLEHIAEEAERQGIKPPAISIIGDVVGLSEALAWYDKKPLSGKSVLITASDTILSEMSDKIERLGGEALDCGLIYPSICQNEEMENVMKDIESYSWVVLTSRNGVELFFEQLRHYKVDIRKLSHLKFAVIGSGTKLALEEKGIICDCMPNIYDSKTLSEELVPQLSKEDKVLLARAKEASKELPKQLNMAGIPFTDLAIYETKVDVRKEEMLYRMASEADYITFFSSSAVKAFASMTSEKEFKGKIVSIGPVTTKAIEAMGYKVDIEAEVYTIDGVIGSIISDGHKGGR